MSTTVAPEKILKELTALWVSQGREGEGPHAAGVLRACSITLVVLAESGDDASALGETIAALMPEHPARAIVITLSGAGPRALENARRGRSTGRKSNVSVHGGLLSFRLV